MLSRILTMLLLGLSLMAGSPTWAAKVNINKANSAALQENLSGIGPVKAQAIIDYRRKHGAFKRLDDLTNVPGIGETTLEKIRRDLSLSSGITKGSGKSLSKPATSPSRASTRSRQPKSFDKVEKPRGKRDMQDSKGARKAKGDSDRKAKKKTKADNGKGDKKSKKAADKKKSATKKKARKDKKGDKKKGKKSKKDQKDKKK